MMLISWSAFSQKDTTLIVPNKDSVTISKKVAQKITKDLLYADVLKQENILLKEDTALLIKVLVIQDSVLNIRNKQIELYQISMRDFNTKEDQYKSLLKSSNKQVKWLKFQRSSAGILLISLLTFIALKN